MRKYINQANLPISVAIFLATDEYDHDSTTVSATALLKPLRQIILAQRVPKADAVIDIKDVIASRLGTAIHNGIEQSWKNNSRTALLDLGYPSKLADRIAINPEPAELAAQPDMVPIYMEQRKYREINGFKISGKFDFISEGIVEDFKTTSTYSYVNDTKSDDFRMQGSIYRWLAPDVITADQMRITYVFMDWSAAKAKAERNYPQQRILPVMLDLLPPQAAQNFIVQKLADITKYRDAPEEAIPLCNDKELWRKDPQWKYYKNPEKRSRSTKNFDNQQEAYLRLAEDKNVGVVVEKPGEVVACKYCPAFSVCSQKDSLIADGSLQL